MAAIVSHLGHGVSTMISQTMIVIVRGHWGDLPGRATQIGTCHQQEAQQVDGGL